jgi:hypothetical protein
VKIVEEAIPMIKKYIGKLQLRYSTSKGFDGALSKGMKILQKLTGIPEVTYYWARHSFATCARNECKISKDDKSLALNHDDAGHRMTDIYIAKDWKIVDDVQIQVVSLMRNYRS